MRTILLLASLTLAMPAFADNSAQQEKMKACNADATARSLKGDERKAFMKDCLSAKAGKAADGKALTPQQERMKTCNADAKVQNLSGDARKSFMSECLKVK